MSYPRLLCFDCLKSSIEDALFEGLTTNDKQSERTSEFVKELATPSPGCQEDLLYKCRVCGYVQLAFVVIEGGVRKIINTFAVNEETGTEMQEVFGEISTFDPL